MDVVSSLVPLAFLAFVVAVVFAAFRQNKQNRAKQEAYFVSMFPDLQPYFHPGKLVEFVTARLARTAPKSGDTWPRPPGFDADRATVSCGIDKKGRERETWTLVDAAGAALTDFIFETHPEGGVLRVGDGKFTVDTRVKGQPKVRYWHPDREFKWTPLLWKFTTRLTEDTFDSSDRGTSWSSDSTSSSTAATVAGAAGIAAAGGAFDGGGASHAWSEGGASSARSDSGDRAGATATSY